MSITVKREEYRRKITKFLIIGLVILCITEFIEFLYEPELLTVFDVMLHLVVCSAMYLQISSYQKKLREMADFVTVCAWCGEIKNGGDDQTKLSHTICETCYEKNMKG